MIRLNHSLADLPASSRDAAAAYSIRPFVVALGAVLARVYQAMITVQEARAKRIVHSHLAWQDDATLARLGVSATDIAALRRRGPDTSADRSADTSV